MKSPITTHVLDTTKGIPAEGISVLLEFQSSQYEWKNIANGTTNHDGRILDLLPESYILQNGTYRLTFDTGNYFKKIHTETFYPYVQIVFTINDEKRHYHVPLLLNPFGYSTYRGS